MVVYVPVSVLERGGHEVPDIGQEEEEHGDADQSEAHGEHHTQFGLGSDVAVSDGRHDARGEDERVGHAPVVVPRVDLAVVLEVLYSGNDHFHKFMEMLVNLGPGF